MSRFPLTERGQVSLFDAVIALTVFMMLFLAINSIWNDRLQNLRQQQQQNDMQFKALEATIIMMKTQGIPFNWEKRPNDANAIGLIEKSGKIKKQKLNALNAMDYNTAQSVLNVSPYDFRLEFDTNGTSNDMNIGKNTDENSLVVSIERSARFEGGNAIVRFKIFR